MAMNKQMMHCWLNGLGAEKMRGLALPSGTSMKASKDWKGSPLTGHVFASEAPESLQQSETQSGISE